MLSDAHIGTKVCVIGANRTLADFLSQSYSDYSLGRAAEQLLHHMVSQGVSITPSLEPVDCVQASIVELGFTPGYDPTQYEVFSKLEHIGARRCAFETALDLWDAPLEAPVGRVFMDPLLDASNGPCLFEVQHDAGRRCLRAVSVVPARRWLATVPVIFRL